MSRFSSRSSRSIFSWASMRSARSRPSMARSARSLPSKTISSYSVSRESMPSPLADSTTCRKDFSRRSPLWLLKANHPCSSCGSLDEETLGIDRECHSNVVARVSLFYNTHGSLNAPGLHSHVEAGDTTVYLDRNLHHFHHFHLIFTSFLVPQPQ